MIRFFKQGFAGTNKNLGFVGVLFLIDVFLIILSGILSLEWISDQASARVIVLHYDIFKIVRAAPEFIKLAVEIFVVSGSIAAAGQFITSGHIKIDAFFRSGIKSYLRLCLLTLIWFLTAVLPTFAVALPYIYFFDGAVNLATGILIAAIAIFMLTMTVFFFFAPFILVLDGTRTIESIRKSFGAAKKNFGAILSFIGIYFAIMLALYFLGTVAVSAYLGTVELLTQSSRIGQFARFSIEAIFSFAARYIYIAGVIATALFYNKIKNSNEKEL
ncbi:MAG: hypothetical protein WC527_05235 [Candidatus Margulisiibacteriota bacterium]